MKKVLLVLTALIFVNANYLKAQHISTSGTQNTGDIGHIGKMGIGTISPSLKLDVYGSVIGFPVTLGTDQTYGLFRLSSSPTNVVLDFGVNGGSTASSWLQATNKTNLSTIYPLLLNPNGGNVGIGTTSPTYQLTVVKDGGVSSGEHFTFGLQRIAGTNFLVAGYRGNDSIVNGAVLRSTNGIPLYLGTTSSTQTITILNSGYVGIKNTDPIHALDVFGNIGLSQNIMQTGTTTQLDINPYKVLRLGRSTNNADFSVAIHKGDNTTTINHLFKGNGNSYVCSNNGNFGIGTTNPIYGKLHIEANSLGSNSVLGFYTNDGTYRPRIWVKHVTGENPFINYLEFDNTYSTQIGYANYIFSHGNVGIGTTNTFGYKLAVNGTIGAKEVTVELTSPWPDYVFNTSYKLRTLSEVEQFIKTNNHLPDVPSEQEVKENGVSLGEMNAKLLQKVEELTLYMIDQQKQINELKEQNTKLVNEIKNLNI